jgi:peptide/nickel transport system substrate-binding protein
LRVKAWALAAILFPGFLQAASSPVNNPESLFYAIIGEVDSLDPHWHYDAISQAISNQIYETLLFPKGTSVETLEPLISEAVPSRSNGLISPDALSYSFPIRTGVKFHDGSLLTPEDARYSVMRFLLTDRASGPSFLLLEPLLGKPSLAGPDQTAATLRESIYEEVDQAVQIEGRNLVLRLKKPYAPLLSILSAFCPIVSKTWTARNGGWDGRQETWLKFYDPPKQKAALFERANGSGPFKLERWDRTGRQLILSRHENYWRGQAQLKRLVFRTVSEPSTRKLLIEAGDADALMMERQFLPQVQGIAGVNVEDGLPFLETHNVFVMNFRIKPQPNPYIGSGKLDGNGIPADFFSDIDVRKGFAHAFNYEAYIRDGYRGKGERARGPIPKGVFGYNPTQKVREFSQQKAEEHFRKALGGKVWERGLHFSLTYMEGRADRQLACQILKAGVEAINPRFKIDVRGIQGSTWLDAYAAGKLPMTNARWHLDFPDPDNPVTAFLHSSGYYAKAQGYSNPEADRLIEEARLEQDPKKRSALYAHLQAIAYDDVAQIYTLDTYFFQVTRSWVKGWSYNPITLYGYLYPVYKSSKGDHP